MLALLLLAVRIGDQSLAYSPSSCIGKDVSVYQGDSVSDKSLYSVRPCLCLQGDGVGIQSLHTCETTHGSNVPNLRVTTRFESDQITNKSQKLEDTKVAISASKLRLRITSVHRILETVLSRNESLCVCFDNIRLILFNLICLLPHDRTDGLITEIH